MASRDSANNILLSTTHLSKRDRLQALRNIGYSQSGAYKVLKVFEDSGNTYDERKLNGAKPKISGTAACGLIRNYNNATHKSLRRIARNFNVCPQTISNTLKRYGAMCHKRKKAPLFNPAK